MSQPKIVKCNDHYFEVVEDKTHWWKAFPVGGGFETYLPKRDCATVDKLPAQILPGKASIDGGTEYPCLCNPHDRWNGWAKPYFDEATVKQILADYDDCQLMDRTEDTMLIGLDEHNTTEVIRTQYGWTFDGWCWDVEF